MKISCSCVRVYLAKQALPLCSRFSIPISAPALIPSSNFLKLVVLLLFREIGKGEKMTWPTDGLNFSSASSDVSSDDVSSDEANGRDLHMVASDVAYSDHKMNSR
ncbi:hypothetical protein L6452_13225 [Arctium lappa]|uniref:Uncharacterized protein n=1 Tax=Arctium lappa TaxID=4217 RepID=A0ACB9CHK4_ARCLA|nr:hypothetical protein L6452_13225 [Arctium lappa]